MLDKGRITESHSRSRTDAFSNVEGKFEGLGQGVGSKDERQYAKHTLTRRRQQATHNCVQLTPKNA